ncbi:unnamed protein product [Rotaria sp. Silwood1]|nr:unnamed protein product [Rotaria sp. Silwood1]CAF1270455.1 unnamed protein product [Rotaria sp. Silwood1]CAF3475201.1 unnamed protein product [Rotaria sp. Silwood1]CAF4773512.1 unnamed protein product [Rotaria sp. Silwood1]
MRGRVTFLPSFQIPTESGARLTVALQDTSLADAPAKVIARSISKAIRFPIAFAIKYLPSQISEGRTYSLSATIRDKNNELLYINDVNIRVTPVGPRRTKFIDVPVIKTKPVVNKNQWPELVGKNGQAAVNIIKKETGKIIQMYIDKFIPKITLGFTNVVIVKEGAPVTLDYRTDRVRVFVDDKGIVRSVPTIG